MRQMELHRKLLSDEIITFNKQYLSQLVSEGKIPYTIKDGHKHFKYMQVLKALSDGGQIKHSDDPTEKTIASTKLELYHWRGMLAKQKHDVEAGVLLNRDDVERKAFTVGRILRDQLLMLPERLCGDIFTAHSVEDAEEIIRNELEMILEGVTPEAFMP